MTKLTETAQYLEERWNTYGMERKLERYCIGSEVIITFPPASSHYAKALLAIDTKYEYINRLKKASTPFSLVKTSQL